MVGVGVGFAARRGAILVAVDWLGLGLVVLIGIVLVGELITVDGTLVFWGLASRGVERGGQKLTVPRERRRRQSQTF